MDFVRIFCKKHFKKGFFMSGGKRKVLLRGLYVSPICNKSYFEQDIKVRDHDLHQI